VEAVIDWRQSAAALDRKIRAFYPDPIAYAALGGERVKIHRAMPTTTPTADSGTAGTILRASTDGILVACGEGALAISELQFPGGKVLSARDVLNGRAERFAPGTTFDDETAHAAQ
jgi:methionyl-tRNA formyltransferase